MGKKSRLKVARSQETGVEPVTSYIPEQVIHGAELIVAEASKKGEMTINLQGGSYSKLDQFDVNGHKIEIGAVSGRVKPVNPERIRKLFKLASSFASQHIFNTQSFDPTNETFKPVTVETQEHNVDGYLIYLPVGAARYKQAGNEFRPDSFTTGTPILAPGEPSVSFVTSDPTVRPADRAMSTATEIMQNRSIVTKVSFENGKSYSSSETTNAYQETFANGVGNFAGSVALGWSYRQYLDFLSMYERTTTLWSGVIRNRLGRPNQFIAPNLMFSEEAYGKVADGQIPENFEPIPRQPLKRS